MTDAAGLLTEQYRAACVELAEAYVAWLGRPKRAQRARVRQALDTYHAARDAMRRPPAQGTRPRARRVKPTLQTRAMGEYLRKERSGSDG